MRIQDFLRTDASVRVREDGRILDMVRSDGLSFLAKTDPVPYAAGLTILGDNTANSITGTAGDELIYARDGADLVDAGDGNDRVFAGAGDDVVQGGNGNDMLRGGDGADVLLGGRGRDTIYGDDGDDRILGGGGYDLLRGGAGNDLIVGGAGNDTAFGGDGVDRFIGGAGNDRFDGGAGTRDKAFFSGNFADYSLVYDAGLDRVIIRDLRPGAPDGTDLLVGVELLQFSDGLVRVNTANAEFDLPPVFTSGATASIAENQTSAYSAAATDANGTTLTYSLSGTDAALFDIDSATGDVTFKAAPDYETPGDAGGDNVYDIVVTASDGTNTTDQAVAIAVINENDNAPVYPYPGVNTDQAESRFQLYGTWVGANDADGDTLTYTLSGADADIFYFSSPGNLQFRLPPDFETPLDADGDNIYEITVTASDGVHSTVKDFTVTVTDVVEPAQVDTVTLNASEGFIIRGAGEFDYAGWDVASAGDINGDGFEDLLIGLNGDSGHGPNGGSAYVIFGTASGFGVDVDGRQVIDLASLSPAEGFVIRPSASDAYSGVRVSSAGDINGDGFDDLILGAYYNSDGGTYAGQAAIVFGTASGFGAEVGGLQVLDLTSLSAAEGFIIVGDNTLDRLGSDVSSAGDVNGDGYDDLIIGARNGDDGGSDAGEAYIVFGTASGFGTAVGGRQVIDVTSLNAATGFIIQGDFQGDRAGRSVSSAGDINGDGFDDLVVGAPFGYDSGGTESGEAYVIFGTNSGFGSTVTTGAYDRQVIDLTSFTPAEGFIIQGHRIGERTGYSVAAAGDINGDGFDDIFVGASGASPNGAGYVVFGTASGFGTLVSGRQVLDLTSISASEGFMIQGEETRDFAGFSVESAGDINGDGFDDLIIGAPFNDTTGYGSGRAYVIYGTDAGFGANYTRLVDDVDIQRIDLSNLTEVEGFVIEAGASGDYAGWAVSSAGDLNGDGFDDLAVGAPRNDNAATSAGETYVIFGSANGSTAAVTATGTAAAESIIGAAGDDTLTGAGGADVIRGGAGDDVIGVSDAIFARIDGGGGNDTLRLDGTGIDLDFTAIAQNAVTGIERIDLTGSGDNTLTLAALDVFDMMDAREGGSAILRVNGDAGDIVNLDDNGWVALGSIVENTVTYDRYSNGNAEIRVEDGVTLVAGVAPVITSAATATAAENQTAAYTATATDGDGTSPAFSISGVDAALFDIDAATGAVTFKLAPDYELPGDTGGDNVYDITVTASDGINTADLAVAITVTNVAEVQTPIDPGKPGGDTVVMGVIDPAIRGDLVSLSLHDGYLPALEGLSWRDGFQALDSETPWGDRDHTGLDDGIRGASGMSFRAAFTETLADHAVDAPANDVAASFVPLGETVTADFGGIPVDLLPITMSGLMPGTDFFDVAFLPSETPFDLPIPDSAEGWH